jgi:NAD(P)-dependent dehydrogenase (short-subunit alcohol dehydrogenase family)
LSHAAWFNRRVIAVIGSAGTIGRHVATFLEEWRAGVVRRDFRLEGDEYVDARDSASLSRALDGAAVVVNCADYRLNLDVMRGAAAAGAQVEMRSNGSVVVGTALTHGGSAKSTSEPAARAAAELAEGRLSAPGTSPPEQAIDDPEGFLALLDTDLRWTS